MIGGPQGSGIDTAANIFGKACGYGGYYLYGKREYHSNIKGLHSYFHFRISEKPIAANVNDVDMLAAFDAETIVRHIHEVPTHGGVILDEDDLGKKITDVPSIPSEFIAEFKKRISNKGVETIEDLIEEAKQRKIQTFIVPFTELLKKLAAELGIEKLSKITRMKNVLTLGITFSLFNYNANLVEKAIRGFFAAKPRIADINVLGFRKAYEHSKQVFGLNSSFTLEQHDAREKRIFLSGFQAVALGKILGGCRMQTYYPITPAADESEYLEAHETFKVNNGVGAIIVIQTEDEIAAVNMASGAALSGVRAATATSGPGFSLMVEGLSWAGNNEVPIVITYYQRGAPSTGLPTRHGQDDLRFAIHAGHGEFPRIVVASGDIRECFFDAINAFNYAEKFQMPVIHLIDKAIANSSQSYAYFDLSQAKIDRGAILSGWNAQDVEYKRFKFSDSGVSPRAFLGTKGAVMWYTGDEHNEVGHISEEPMNRNMMIEKRMKKLEAVSRETPLKERLNLFGSENAENIIVSWGSPKGAILEAIEMLESEGADLAFLQIKMLHPLPESRVRDILSKASKKIAVEMNYSAQLASIISEKTGIFMDQFVLKYNGRPMTATEVYWALNKILQGKAPRRQVLDYGA